MQNLIYKWVASAKAPGVDYTLLRAINVIEKHNLFNDIKDGKDGKYLIIGDKPYFFKTVKENKTIYDMFIENLHIHMSESNNEKVYSIRLKKRDEDWDFKKNDDGVWDVSHPVTETFEIYVWYDVPVLDITRSIGYVYKHGSWDKYYIKTFAAFMKSINEMTIAYKFGADYKKKKREKNGVLRQRGVEIEPKRKNS